MTIHGLPSTVSVGGRRWYFSHGGWHPPERKILIEPERSYMVFYDLAWEAAYNIDSTVLSWSKRSPD